MEHLNGSDTEPAACGLTLWRVLSDAPYYKPVLDIDTDAVSLPVHSFRLFMVVVNFDFIRHVMFTHLINYWLIVTLSLRCYICIREVSWSVENGKDLTEHNHQTDVMGLLQCVSSNWLT